MPKANLPGINTSNNIPSGQIPNTNPIGSLTNSPTLPNNNLPSITNNIQLPNSTLGTNGLPTDFPSPNLDVVNSGIPNEVGEVSKLSTQAGSYSTELNNIKEGKIDSAQIERSAEEQLSKLKETKKIREQQEAIEKYKQMSQRYRDPEAMKKELEKNSKELAFDKLEANKSAVNEAIGNMAKMKRKYGEVKSLTTIPKHRYNSMKGKPFVERLLPGVSLQMQGGTNFLVDINPYVGYCFSDRWVAGLGWNERISSNFNRSQYFIAEDHIYGVRSFVQFKVASKLTLRLEIEQMNTIIRQPNTTLDNAKRKWAISYLAGIKQDFRISKKVNGNAQILYNLYDPKRESPYADKVQIRVGFEFPIKKK